MVREETANSGLPPFDGDDISYGTTLIGGKSKTERQWFAASLIFLSLAIACFILVGIGEGVSSSRSSAFPGAFTAEASPHDLMNKGAQPCDDFYEFACGGFAALAPPQDKDQWHYTFDGMKERNFQKMHSALLGSHKATEAGVLYQSCLDEEAIEHAGWRKPLKPFFADVDRVDDNTNHSLSLAVAALHGYGAKAFFFWDVGPDADSPTQALYLLQGGITLPGHSFYTSTSQSAKVRALRLMIHDTMLMTGMSEGEAEQAAADAVDVEVALARAYLTAAAERQAESLPLLSLSQVAAGIGGRLEWELIFEQLGVPASALSTPSVRVLDVAFFQAMTHLLEAHPPSYFKSYLRWRALDALTSHLGKAFQARNLEFRKQLFGVERDPPRARLCLHTLNTFTPYVLGQVFVDLSPTSDSALQASATARAGVILDELRHSFGDIIDDSEWMSNTSRVAAQQKLTDMLFQVGSPKVFPKLSFVPSQTSWFDNSVAVARSAGLRQTQRVGKQLSRTDWGHVEGAMTVNAFYNVHTNVLFAPLALLQPPIQPTSGVSVFGSLGGLLGHEMTHGFDNTGRLFGPNFAVTSWWDRDTIERFKARAHDVDVWYSSFHYDDITVSGERTLGEDIADMGGLRTSHDALMNHLRKGGSVSSPTTTELQDFFLSWAQTWCHTTTSKMRKVAARTDPHAPSRTRVNAALGQFAPFAEAYKCPVGSSMRAPQCSVW